MKQTNLDRRLIAAIDTLLTEYQSGLGEYELITLLDSRYHEVYPKPDLSDPLLLFQHHFFLRHSLYTLQNELSNTGAWFLEINAVRIIKHSVNPTSIESLPGPLDELKSYYLNLSNLNKESELSVQRLLDSFWHTMAKHQHRPESLTTLGLTGKETPAEQKKHYKILVQQHHPDKGGDEEHFKRIQNAWEQLKK